uniref:Uncharacterized protein n=1 Tax=Triticum urartu TaxID=4572 RepID=A0A8R7QXG0_TRIUA
MISPALHCPQISLCFFLPLLRRQRRVILPRQQHVVEHRARPNAGHGGARALLLVEPRDGAPPHQAPDGAPRRAAHCLVGSVEMGLRRAGDNRPLEGHHEPAQERVPVPICDQVLRGVE